MGEEIIMFATTTITKVNAYQTRIDVRYSLIDQLVMLIICNTAEVRDLTETEATEFYEKTKEDLKHSVNVVLSGYTDSEGNRFNMGVVEDVIRLINIVNNENFTIGERLEDRYSFKVKEGINLLIDPSEEEEELY